MTSFETPVIPYSPDVLNKARLELSGKRIALLGFTAAAGLELTQVITAADAFTRSFPPNEVSPSSQILKPFELILLNMEAAAGTSWLQTDEATGAQERCIAVGPLSVLLQLAAETQLAFREFWPYSARPEELLLRCVLGLRGGHRPGRQTKSAAGSTVVLADDDPSVTGLVRRAFERNGMTCELAATGAEALALITRLKPCAAVLDVNMPDIDGFEVLARVKSVAELAPTKVILLTGSEQEADVIRGFSLGADDYVCKPFNPMELTVRLMRTLGRI